MPSKKCSLSCWIDAFLIGSLLGMCYTVEIAKNNTSLKQCLDLCRKDKCSNFCYTSTDRSCALDIHEVACHPLAAPNNGNVSLPSGRTVQQKAYFSCSQLFHLTGNEALTCLGNGSWNGTVPTCQLVSPVTNGECSATLKGLTYKGTVNVTNQGATCLRWDDPGTGYLPWVQTTLSKFPETSLADASNYCRNPDEDAGGPWCYYAWQTWEYCNVPLCNCIEPYKEFNGMCMKYEEQAPAISWATADLKCQADNATLMMYKDIPISHAIEIARSNGYTGNKYIAVGGLYNTTTSTWIWSDQSSIGHIPWKSPEPTGNGEECMLIHIADGSIHDAECFSNLVVGALLCQKNFS